MTRTKRITCIMAVMLCVAAFLFPTAAYAASDTEAPTVRAWINGESLHIEAVDAQSNVEAVRYQDICQTGNPDTRRAETAKNRATSGYEPSFNRTTAGCCDK